ncbi:GNAT family N-acetyltransferase [Phytohabitans houttuyneae]|uniref:N-acetyltransferase n=1 Tax=Phytohabitans houttuyneae TaxID=1076126 RepID=A0A6V8KK09_9ACTN|nr:GNAT family N-acetyltransferase [Phytohabitans houttuyneae]GFJ84204.1 N-acetyltransferase [Phytohabitans houttuyneae]
MGKIEIRRVGYLDPDAQVMVEAALDDLRVRYDDGEGDGTPVDPSDFEPPRGAFFVAYLDGEPVASGAWRTHGADGAAAEIKRMYTAPAARGRGIARAVLAEVERSARDSGLQRAVLETGGRQPEAIRLYQTSGYRRIANFGFYRDEPDVHSFGKELLAGSQD